MKNIYSFIAALFFCMNVFAQSGNNCNNAIQVTASAACTPTSVTTTDSVRWFKFIATSQYMQIRAVSPTFGISGPHLHEMFLYAGSCSGLQFLERELFADVNGANELTIDASGLTIGNTYYVKASRMTRGVCAPTPSPSAMPCGSASSITFSLCVRSLNVIIPKDFGLELPAASHVKGYWE